MDEQNNSTPTEATSEELERLFEEAYGNSEEHSEFTQVVEEANEGGTQAPKEEGIEESPQEGEGEEGEHSPQEEHNDPYAYLDDLEDGEVKERVLAQMRKLENERKAAVGRSAYFQRQYNLHNKAGGNTTSAPGAPKKREFQPPQTKEEWNALLEADPQAAKAFESRIQDERDALLDHIRSEIEQEYAPIRQAYVEQRQQHNAWIEDQTRIVYETIPELDNILASPEFNQWKAVWEQRSPGFNETLKKIHHAYGDESNPGIVDILEVFHKEVFGGGEEPAQAGGEPASTGAADKAVKARQARQQQSPPERNKAAAVSPKREKTQEELFEEAMNAELRSKGLL